MGRELCRLPNLCAVPAIPFFLGLALLVPWCIASEAGTITEGAVNLPNPLGTSSAGATLGTVSLSGDIATAQAFLFTTVGNQSTLSSPSAGYFYGLSVRQILFSSVSFEFTATGPNTSASFSSPLFGSFQSSFAVQTQNSDNGTQKTRVFNVYGTYTSGTISQMNFPSEGSPRGDTSPYPVDAVWQITLNQQTGAGQSITFASALSFPVAVPEPGASTLAVVGVGVLAVGYVARRRGKPSSCPTPP